MTRRRSLWAAAGTVAAVALASAPVSAAAPLPAPYVHLRVAQHYDASGHNVVSVSMATNAGSPLNTLTGDGWPLVFTQPWHTTCQSDPRRPLPGGKTQLVYAGIGLPIRTGWQTTVSFATARAQQLTLCGYVVMAPHPEISYPNPTVALTQTSISVRPPRRGGSQPFNQGPWRTCPARRADQLLRILANSGLADGCYSATVIASTWIGQWRGNYDQRDNWGNDWRDPGGAYISGLTYPAVKWTSVPVASLHRTLMCQETAVTPSALLSDLVVNCGLASFRFAPRL